MIVEYHDVIERSRRRPGIEFTLGTDLKKLHIQTHKWPPRSHRRDGNLCEKCKWKRLLGADAGKHKCRTPGSSLIYLLFCSFALWEWHPVAINDQMAKVVESRSS